MYQAPFQVLCNIRVGLFVLRLAVKMSAVLTMLYVIVLVAVAMQLVTVEGLKLPKLNFRKVAASGLCVLSITGPLSMPQSAYVGEYTICTCCILRRMFL